MNVNNILLFSEIKTAFDKKSIFENILLIEENWSNIKSFNVYEGKKLIL